MPRYVLGLGSNLKYPLIQLRNAIEEIKNNHEILIQAYSQIYLSEALIPENAPTSWDLPFLNAAILIETKKNPKELLQEIKLIEEKLGRNPNHEFWSPREIDIDILCSDYLVTSDDDLTIPHKELLNRSFALLPLLDVLPNWHHPKALDLNLNEYAKNLNLEQKTQVTNQLLFGPEIMGILNITPDSFSDGGQFDSVENAIKQFNKLVDEGAHIIDIGAESTKKNAISISHTEEWKRLKPLLDKLDEIYPNLKIKPKISIDTRHWQTIEKCLNYSFVQMINDIEGSDIAEKGALLEGRPDVSYIMMDNWRNTSEIQFLDDQVHEKSISDFERVYFFAERQLDYLVASGMNKNQIIFDPGFGFAKSSETVRNLIYRLNELKQHLNIKILVGHSRKQSVVNPLNFIDKNSNFDFETALISSYLMEHNVDIIRTHNVNLTKKASIINQFYKP